MAGSVASAQTWPPPSTGANVVDSSPVTRSKAITWLRDDSEPACSTRSKEPPANIVPSRPASASTCGLRTVSVDTSRGVTSDDDVVTTSGCGSAAVAEVAAPRLRAPAAATAAARPRAFPAYLIRVPLASEPESSHPP